LTNQIDCETIFDLSKATSSDHGNIMSEEITGQGTVGDFFGNGSIPNRLFDESLDIQMVLSEFNIPEVQTTTQTMINEIGTDAFQFASVSQEPTLQPVNSSTKEPVTISLAEPVQTPPTPLVQPTPIPQTAPEITTNVIQHSNPQQTQVDCGTKKRRISHLIETANDHFFELLKIAKKNKTS
jgi:hypothetical protein